MKLAIRIVLFCLIMRSSGLAQPPPPTAQGNLIRTVAGTGTSGYSGDGGQATSAAISGPEGIAVDGAGVLYFADSSNYRVRRVTPGGVISTVAGNGTSGFSGDGGPATSAQIGSPVGLALDAAGALYFTDPRNNRVRKVTPNGVISTVAGNGILGFSGDGGPATSAQLNMPLGVAVDAAGILYVSDRGNQRVRKVTPNGVISTVAGNGTTGFSGDGGPATSAQLDIPFGLAVDADGVLYFADVNNRRVRKVAPSGVVNTVAGNGLGLFNGDGIPATSAYISPRGIAVDATGNIYISDFNNRIRMVTRGNVITTVAGNGTRGFSGDGGLATSAQITEAEGVAVDAAGVLYIADLSDCA
jgi:sugar lactone lactonase YvrE